MSNGSLKGKGYSLISCNQALQSSKIAKVYSGDIFGKGHTNPFQEVVIDPFGRQYKRPIKGLSPNSGMGSQFTAGAMMNLFRR